MLSRVILKLPKDLCLAIVNGLIVAGMYLKVRLVGPRILHLTLPSGCDHDCPFCITDIHGKGKLEGREVLSFEDIQKLVDDSIAQLTLKFNFTSNGEPLLYSKLDKLIEYIYQKSHGKAEIQIITNGTSLKNNKLEFYKKYNVSFWVSLHSSVFESWQQMHRPLHHAKEKFEALNINLKMLSSLGVRVTIHSVVTKLNINDLKHLGSFVSEVGAKNLSLTRLIDHDELKPSQAQEIEFEAVLLSLKVELDANGVAHNLDGFEIMLEEGQDGADDDEPTFYQKNRCYINFLMKPVTDEGIVKVCNGGYALGNVKDKSIKAKEKQFRSQSLSIAKNKGRVSNCNCDACPQLVMNKIANKYVLY